MILFFHFQMIIIKYNIHLKYISTLYNQKITTTNIFILNMKNIIFLKIKF